ncbi:DUF1194 domain-containing protein [Limobrevibacterium gyesilva]|uniref:DUF1194 domain-containing protein n=1 Tax=Limobrevibacterium gyesilva TaxID=2991712 RepID=A0AA41YME0_9PROT|nr:DUF1194 domain-containing protein [Limobrevibacterium gyesilva]MCW3476571.1 DUF1194 domain-containing protein [Limobrevibacterium gyesilva]
MRWLFVVLALLPASVWAAEPVDLALVLVTDVSRSIDDSEFDLEKQGYATAFTDREVLAAIKGGAIGAIAVNYVEFASAYEVKTVVDWMVIRDETSARAFVDKLLVAPRSYYGRTAISAGIEMAMRNLANSGFEAQRRVIDVCGDGTNNNGRDVAEARDEAVEAGITINGLAIINEHPVSWTFAHVQPPGGLANYYRENVAGGIGNFVLEVHEFRAFGTAMTRKLINEIADLGGAWRAGEAVLPGRGAPRRF